MAFSWLFRGPYCFAQLLRALTLEKSSDCCFAVQRLRKFQRVTIQGAQPSARLSEKFVSQRGSSGETQKGTGGKGRDRKRREATTP